MLCLDEMSLTSSNSLITYALFSDSLNSECQYEMWRLSMHMNYCFPQEIPKLFYDTKILPIWSLSLTNVKQFHFMSVLTRQKLHTTPSNPCFTFWVILIDVWYLYSTFREATILKAKLYLTFGKVRFSLWMSIY